MLLKTSFISCALGSDVIHSGALIAQKRISPLLNCQWVRDGVSSTITSGVIKGASPMGRPLYQVRLLMLTLPKIHLPLLAFLGMSDKREGLPSVKKAISQCQPSCSIVPGKKRIACASGQTRMRFSNKPSVIAGNWYSSTNSKYSLVGMLMN